MQFKHILPAVLALFSAPFVQAQNLPNLGQTAPAGTFTNMGTPAEVTISAVPINAVTTYIPVVPISDTASINTSSQAAAVRQKVIYSDGFNRTYQSITKNAANVGGTLKHLVQVYDNREQRDLISFLPYATTNSNQSSTAFQEQRAFYENLYPDEGYSSFSQSVNTSSSAERSIASYSPGKTGVGLKYGTSTKSVTNPANQVIIWGLDGNGTPVANGYYLTGELIGVETTSPDAQGSSINVSSPRSRIYKDRAGNLILSLNADSSYTTTSGNQVTTGISYTYTYYVYDDMGHLRCTITPKAYKYYQSQGSITPAILNNLCFQYQYDTKGRMSGMKKPGEDDFTYIVYDHKDRPVMRQTPLERQVNEWEVTFLDVLGRTKVTSVYNDAQSGLNRNGWQDAIDTWTGGGIYADLLDYLVTPAMESQYPVGDNPLEDPANNAYSLIENNTVMTISYYDDYTKSYYNNPQDLNPTGTLFTECSNNANLPLLVNAPGAEIPALGRIYGMQTASIVRILRSPNAITSRKVGDWRSSLSFYDDKGRMIYTKTYVTDKKNGGSIINIEYAGVQYDFAGHMLVSGHVLNNLGSQENNLGGSHSEYTQNQYDANTGALVKTVHQVDGNAWVTLSSYLYDDLGRMARKTLGNGGEIQQLTYNIRGQLTGINGVYAETAQKGGYSKSFGESLKFDYGFSKPRFDGKLAGMVWRGTSATDMYAYGYDYTQNGALKTANFNHLEARTWDHQRMDYSVSNLFYDKNGNMISLKQRGIKPGTTTPVDMDDLRYTYEDGDISNRLTRVDEQSTAPYYNAGDFHGPSASSTYDANGNLASNSGYKDIRSITYTRFNKPLSIDFQNGSSIEYSYDATGNKVEELAIDRTTGITKRTDYIGNAVYQNTYVNTASPGNKTDSLQYLLTGDGRTTFNFTTKKPREEFFAKDHLGNVRSVIQVSAYDIKKYFASYEIASAHLENLIFDNIEAIRDTKPGGVGDDEKSANLNGGDPSRTIGTSVLLHVMAGDKVAMNVSSFYNSYASQDDAPLPPNAILDQVVSTLTGGVGGLGGSESHNTKLVQSLFTPDNFANYTNLLNSITDDSKPKAYLNYILFDENMNMTAEMSGAFQATGDGNWTDIGTSSAIEVPVNGYLAVYLSNATVNVNCLHCADVYFDNLAIQISNGNLLEENHYYPHGLPIFGLGSRTTDVNYKDNRKKYQANEYITDQGLNWMSFGARQYDPQIGRFLSVDPVAALKGQDKNSPYAAMGNQPESAVDPNGLSPTFNFSGNSLQYASTYGGETAGGSGSVAWSDGGMNDHGVGGDMGMSFSLMALGNVISIVGNGNISTLMDQLGQGTSVSKIAGDYKNSTGAFSKQSGVGGMEAAYERNNSKAAESSEKSNKGNDYYFQTAPTNKWQETSGKYNGVAYKFSLGEGVNKAGDHGVNFVAYVTGEGLAGFSNLKWVQTKRIVGPYGTLDWHWDGESIKNYPVYNPKEKNDYSLKFASERGFTQYFYDFPTRNTSEYTVWTAQTTLIGKKNGVYQAIISFTWGFNYENYDSHKMPAYVIPNSSLNSTQIKLINSLNVKP